MTLADINKMIL